MARPSGQEVARTRVGLADRGGGPDAQCPDRKDLRGLPIIRRKRALHGLIRAPTTVLSQMFSIDGRGRDLFEVAERLSAETMWYKIMSRAHTHAEWRWELFQKRV